MMRRSILQILKFTSSKKSDIPFDFSLPPDSQIQNEPNQQAKDTINDKQQIKIWKSKRNGGLLKKLTLKEPQYKDIQTPESKSGEIYQRQFIQALERGSKNRKYYEYELERGEDLIDDIPVDPYYQYKIADIKRMTEDRKDEFQKFQGKQRKQSSFRIENLKKIIQSYKESKHRYQAEEFQKYLLKYPGSLKGPHPEDDIQSYSKYAQKGIPQSLRAQIALKQDQQIKRQRLDQGQTTSSPSGAHVSDLMAEDRPEMGPYSIQGEDYEEQLLENAFTKHNSKVIVPYRQVPLIPNIDFEQYHSYIKKLQLWWEFGYHYNVHNQQKTLSHFSQLLNSMGQQIMRNKQYHQFKPSTYSLYLYYRTLPKQIREHSGVKTVYLGLEHTQPDYTYEEKEEALNQAAYMSLPLDKVSQRLMADVTAKKKYYLTPHLTERIFNIHPEFTWDIHQFLKEVKEQKLRSMSTVKQKEESFPQPPERHKKTELHLANLPIDYYDNDDGFWDDYIDQKLNRHYKVQPLLSKDKVHFIH